MASFFLISVLFTAAAAVSLGGDNPNNKGSKINSEYGMAQSRFGMEEAIPEFDTLKDDPLHLKDPLDDPNAGAIEDMLGLTKEEREELAKEPRIDTPVDIAIKACIDDSARLGCSDNVNPIHCLAQAQAESASDISPQCRNKVEKSMQYACSVELFITHCDGVEMPIIKCLEKNHPKLGAECKDTLTLTKKVLKTIKPEGMSNEKVEDATAVEAQTSRGGVARSATGESTGEGIASYLYWVVPLALIASIIGAAIISQQSKRAGSHGLELLEQH